ncbi:phosphotransferase [Novosphingobium sp. CCH12-A3]|uniref:phosphotransferase n=1 Tax=Novosphingobium sp. CCH12-A3 TaxID=1768752 RepID=UPI000784F7AF|nr:phosphotransferase [Novosphingobium sp. CCH12-A3]
MVSKSVQPPIDPTDAKVYDWLIANIGPVTAFERQPRWRPGWNVVAGGASLYVRGPRGDTYASPVNMYQEAEIHHVFERHGIPAPRVHGMIPDPLCIVMEMLPGRINSGLIEDPEKQAQVRERFIRIVADVHRLPVEAFAAAKLPVPQSPAEIALNLYAPSHEIFRERIACRPWPLMEFAWGWLNRNVPQDRTRVTFVNYDGGQFLFDDSGTVTGLIDFEVSSLGDPAAELSGMRLRDTSEPLGDLTAMVARYEELTGDRISRKLIEFHTAGFCAVNGFLMWPLMFDSAPEQDFIAYLNYCVGTSRWMIRAIADHMKVTLVDPPEPHAQPLGFEQASRHLVRHVEAFQGGTPAENYARDSAAHQAFYLGRLNTYGQSVQAANLADVAALTGVRYDTWEQAQAALSEWVENAGPEADEALVQHFHCWLQRQAFMLRGCGPPAFISAASLQPILER